jgi:hypothetical protein
MQLKIRWDKQIEKEVETNKKVQIYKTSDFLAALDKSYYYRYIERREMNELL